VLKGGSVR